MAYLVEHNDILINGPIQCDDEQTIKRIKTEKDPFNRFVMSMQARATVFRSFFPCVDWNDTVAADTYERAFVHFVEIGRAHV